MSVWIWDKFSVLRYVLKKMHVRINAIAPINLYFILFCPFQAILVKGVVTNDIVGRPTEIRFFYKQAENENYVVYFPNFNLTMRDPGNYGELAMITLPKYVQARFVILGVY